MVSRMSSWATSTLRMVRIRLSVCRARGVVVAREQPLEVIQLVQYLLEPELVDLMDHDEEHLVVLGSLRQGALEREQLVDLQVFAVRRHETVYSRMIVHLLDGTYELFRHFYGQRRFNKGKDKPLGAVAGLLHSVLEMIEKGATHLGVATDHVIESFRNDLWPDYKTAKGSSARSSRSSTRWKRPSPPWASLSGPWSSSRPTTRSPPPPASPRPTKACREGLHLGQRQGSGAVRPRATGWCRSTAEARRSATRKACARSSGWRPS